MKPGKIVCGVGAVLVPPLVFGAALAAIYGIGAVVLALFPSLDGYALEPLAVGLIVSGVTGLFSLLLAAWYSIAMDLYGTCREWWARRCS